MLTVAITFGCLVAAVIAYYLSSNKRRNFPPGPWPLPFIGNLPSLGAALHVGFEKFSKQYGPIVGFMYGPNRAICVHGAKLIKETFNQSSFTGRQNREATAYISGESNGIILSAGETWIEQRRFALCHLREFGFGKSSMEELIMDEVKEFSDWLNLQNGKPVELQTRFALAVVNSLWRIVAGERYDHDDEKLHQILDDLEKSTNAVLGFESFKQLFIFFYPSIGKLFPNWSGWNRLVESSKPRIAMFRRIIKEHADTLREDNQRDFVDVYLQEVKRTTNPASSFHPKIGLESLKSVMADFFLAATDTTSVSLSWLNLYLLHYPRVQKKLQEELDRVVGRTRTTTLSDRKNLPYTEAVILETLRLSSITPYAISHVATEDTKFHGFDIPKGTTIFANLYENHHNPQVWGHDVEEFKPERFLSLDESTVCRHEALMPFSTGRRICLGETLAKNTLFLFASNMAQHFEVMSEEGKEKPALVYKTGQLTLAPLSSKVVMKKRLTFD